MQEPQPKKFPIVILISGHGTNLQAIIDATQKCLPIEICAVISNQSDAYGLKRAQLSKIPNHVIPHQDFQTRDAFDKALKKQIDIYEPKLIVLAGFMRKLGSEFVNHFHNKIINIHPSLLPKYRGLDTHRKVLEAGDKIHGTSIHVVTEDLDSGPTICQAQLSVNKDDTEESLKKRVQRLEHVIYPKVLGWFAEGRLVIKNNKILFDDKILSEVIKL